MDLSKLSDAELEAMAAGTPPAASSMPDLSKLSDAELEAMAGGGQAQPELNAARVGGVMTRAGLKGAAAGVYGLPALASDAFTNLRYAGVKLGAKAGLTNEPNPDDYYGKGQGYFPALTGMSALTDKGLDSAGLEAQRPASGAERVIAGVTEGAASGVGGFLAGRTVQAAGALAGNAPARAVGGFLAAEPGAQAAGGAVAGGLGQGVQEAQNSGLVDLPEWAPAAVGFLGGGLTGAVASKAGRSAAQAASVPSTEGLRTGSRAAYDRAEAAGLHLTPEAMADLHHRITNRFRQEGIYPDMNPGGAGERALMPILDDATAGRPVPLARVDAIRQNIGDFSKSPDPQARRMGHLMNNEVDNVLDSLGSNPQHYSGVTREGAEGAINDLRSGQDQWRRYRKSSAIDNALESAGLRTSTTGSGANGMNVDRQKLRRFADPESTRSRAFSPGEREMIGDVVRGDTLTNALRVAGKFAPTGVVSSIPAGMAFGREGALAAGVVSGGGFLAKGLGELRQRRAVDRLSMSIRAGRQIEAPSSAPGAVRGGGVGFLAGDDARSRPSRYR